MLLSFSTLQANNNGFFSNHGYKSAHLSPKQIKSLSKKWGCDKQLSGIMRSAMNNRYKAPKLSERCAQLMEGRIKQ